jgi:hypothetical protein
MFLSDAPPPRQSSEGANSVTTPPLNPSPTSSGHQRSPSAPPSPSGPQRAQQTTPPRGSSYSPISSSGGTEMSTPTQPRARAPSGVYDPRQLRMPQPPFVAGRGRYLAMASMMAGPSGSILQPQDPGYFGLGRSGPQNQGRGGPQSRGRGT